MAGPPDGPSEPPHKYTRAHACAHTQEHAIFHIPRVKHGLHMQACAARYACPCTGSQLCPQQTTASCSHARNYACNTSTHPKQKGGMICGPQCTASLKHLPPNFQTRAPPPPSHSVTRPHMRSVFTPCRTTHSPATSAPPPRRPGCMSPHSQGLHPSHSHSFSTAASLFPHGAAETLRQPRQE